MQQLCLLATFAIVSAGIAAPAQQPSPAAQLTAAISLPDAITNGVAVAPDGRIFLVIQKQKGQTVPQVAQWIDHRLVPYPDSAWNTWQPGQDASHGFQHANSIRFGPDGTLWVVDTGSPGPGQPILPGGPKLVGIDTQSNQVVKTLTFNRVLQPNSFLDDVRFNGDHAYLTDAGVPGLIVVHMPDGGMYRVLDHDPSTTAQHPLKADGHELLAADGTPASAFANADQIEVSPDGGTVYFQPCSGPMSAIDAEALDDQALPEAERRKRVHPFAQTGTSGGTAIDAAGNLYVSDTDHDRMLRVTPSGAVSTLLQDPRLVWVDAMWITPDGQLWMPAAQLNRTPNMNDGKMTVQFPMIVYTVPVGHGPPAGDHR